MFRMHRASPRRDPVIVPITDIPECDPGATMPVVFAVEGAVAVAFYGSFRWLDALDVDWDRGVVGVRFHGIRSHSFGSPNDEAFHGHPLAKFGLQPYSFATVENSPWIEALRVMNSVHPQHRDASFEAARHVILPFHDSTFECVARGYTVETADGADVTPAEMVRSLIGK